MYEACGNGNDQYAYILCIIAAFSPGVRMIMNSIEVLFPQNHFLSLNPRAVVVPNKKVQAVTDADLTFLECYIDQARKSGSLYTVDKDKSFAALFSAYKEGIDILVQEEQPMLDKMIASILYKQHGPASSDGRSLQKMRLQKTLTRPHRKHPKDFLHLLPLGQRIQ